MCDRIWIVLSIKFNSNKWKENDQICSCNKIHGNAMRIHEKTNEYIEFDKKINPLVRDELAYELAVLASISSSK